MSERKIKLEEVLKSFCNGENNLNKDSVPYVLKAMKEAVRQALELAAENAKVEMEYRHEEITFYTIVDKQSILDTIKQIE